jgi:ferredoxin--NADP+ reductase
MAKILEKKLLRKPDVFYFKVEAPLISKKAMPGQFVILRLHGQGERIPISLADIDPVGGTISLIVMAVGKTTTEMSVMRSGDDILDLCGPLGNGTHIEKVGKVVLVGGGFGVAPLYPIARAFRSAGNEVVCIMGARSKDLLIYEKEMGSVCNRVLITTDDGSRGMKGVVTEALRQELEKGGTGLVVTVGPAVMMKFVAETTRPYGVKTVVSLNPIMVDGTEFDGHQVDWDILMTRQKTFTPEQRVSFDNWKQRHAGVLCE